ncbi:MAG TPA: Holliday junction resolvase RuvX [Rhodanobacteraceae bacterium]|nr:Holliday junction resolvase RuvX [Rhodanobacteraceae bacterium]
MNESSGPFQPPQAPVAGGDARYLGFDFGLRRIGVAVGQSLTASARPLRTLAAHDGVPDWQPLDALVAEWQPAALVVGLPLDVDGNEQPISRAARAFAAALASRYRCPIHFCDERYTSREANARFVEQRRAGSKRRRDAAALDAAAAAIILETWLSR